MVLSQVVFFEVLMENTFEISVVTDKVFYYNDEKIFLR